MAKLHLSERRACRVLGQHRSTQRKVPRGRADEAALTAEIVAFATRYGRYGYRRVAAMLRDPNCEWRAVALVDDDPYKRRRRLSGVPVMGNAHEFAEIAGQYGAETAILAIPSASADLVRDFNRRANRAGIELTVKLCGLETTTANGECAASSTHTSSVGSWQVYPLGHVFPGSQRPALGLSLALFQQTRRSVRPSAPG